MLADKFYQEVLDGVISRLSEPDSSGIIRSDTIENLKEVIY